jgi:acyl-CoA dehydrogenase
MRSIGLAEAALDQMLQRVTDPTRKTFGKELYQHGTIVADIGKSRADIDGARLLVLSAAHQIDKVRAKGAMKDIGIAKFVVPTVALRVVDRAIQSFGAEGLSQDTPLAQYWAGLRTLRFADVSLVYAYLKTSTYGDTTPFRVQMRFTSNRLDSVN